MAYGEYRLSTWPARTSESDATFITVAVVQTNISQSNKMHPTREQQEKDWRRTIELTRQAAAQTPRPRIIVWPETICPVPLNPQMLHVYRSLNDERGQRYLRFHQDISDLARELNVHLFVGSVSIRADDWKSNSVMHYLPDGRQDTAIYDKHALVPFGEYIPWVRRWPWAKRLFMKYLSPYGPDHDYSLVPGDEATVFNVPADGSSAIRITTPICFEDAIARASLRLAYDQSGKRCDLMLNATNDGWYPGLDQGYQQFQMAVFRCVENRVPMARSVNTGISGFIDSNGRVGPFVVADGQMQEVDGIAIADMVIDSRETLWGKWGQRPVVMMTICTALLVIAAAAAKNNTGASSFARA
jgi:apolipoprotein N-acyltransferase